MMDSLTCGGAEKSLISLLPYLSGRGYDITLMLTARGGLFERYVPEGVKIVSVPALPAPGSFVSRLRRLAYSAAIRLMPRANKAQLHWRIVGRHVPALDREYDVAIAYQHGFPTFYIASRVKAARKLCWINVDLPSIGMTPSFCRGVYRRFDAVVAVSDMLRDAMVAHGYIPSEDKCHTVYDIIDPAVIGRMAAEYVPFDRGDGRLHIVTVGRLVRQKGYDIAVEAAAGLRDAGVSFVWHFVGGGIERVRLSAMIAQHGLGDHVRLEGEKLNPYPYMAKCDIYVQPSRFEGFGLTVAEARILGKAPVCTDFSVVTNQIHDGQNGLIVPMTPQGVADGVMRYLRETGLKDRLEANVAMERNESSITESRKVIALIDGSE